MKLRLTVYTFVMFFLAGCGVIPYVPAEYELRTGLIQPFTVNGDVTVSNVQGSTDEAIVYSYMGTKLASDYKAITQVMVDQTTKEIIKNSNSVSENHSKTIDLTITYLKSTYIAFYWKSELRFTATLGNGVIIEKTVNHGSGVVQQDLDGCIAESVMEFLNDPKVVAYLSE